jgi:putative tryptophan/tyrosine transport system substrate-binding protein
MIHRRTIIGMFAIGACVGASSAAPAPNAVAVRHIGYLSGVDDVLAERESLLVPLRELGWREGENLVIERRFANGRQELLAPFAQELARLKVEMVVTNGTPATMAIKNVSTTMPIVMYSAGDPVASGLVASLAHPGGNITGLSNVAGELYLQRLELLRDLLPTVNRVGELVSRECPTFSKGRSDYEQAYQALGMTPIFVDVRSASELERAVAEVARQRVQALIVTSCAFFPSNRDRIMRAALNHTLPTVVDTEYMLESGGLVSYTLSPSERGRRTAMFIHKILRGAKPASLPVEQPTQFVLGINLKTAKALRLQVPQSLLLRADEVVR